MELKVLYLFTGYRGPHLAKVKAGEEQGNGFWGMLRLHTFGITAKHLDLEDFMPLSAATFLRKHINVYWIHLPLYPFFFAYDFVFTSTGYGTQLLHTLLHLHRPRWVMHDFSIMGLLGHEKTFRQKLFAWMVSRCAGIVTLSRDEAEQLQRRFPHLKEHIAFIPYGVDLEYFKPGIALGEGAIFAPGRDPDRDLRALFAAAEGLGKDVLTTTHLSRLEKLRPLPDYVVHKTLSVPELKQAYADASIVVIPLDTSTGLNNAMGVSALYEALAMGKAIVASKTPAMESYLTDGVNGLLVPEGDVEALHEALSRILRDRELRERLSTQARLFAEQHLDADTCTGHLADFFRKIISTPTA
ncbi:MAG: glycosyltransferase family 4 protein [Candidatus Adlerbacteria bacterium]